MNVSSSSGQRGGVQSISDSLRAARWWPGLLLLAGSLTAFFWWNGREGVVRACEFPFGAHAGFLLSSDDANASLFFPPDINLDNMTDKTYVSDRQRVFSVLHKILATGMETGIPFAPGICPRYAQIVKMEGEEIGVISALEDDPELCEVLRLGVSQELLIPYNHGMYHCFRWDDDGDGRGELVTWHNPEAGRQVSVEDLVLAGEIIGRVTGRKPIAFRSPGYHTYLNEDGYSGRGEEKTSNLLKEKGYEIDLNPHSFRYADVFPQDVGRARRWRYAWGDRTGWFLGRSGLRKHWGPFPFERNDDGTLRLFTYPDVNVLPGALERLDRCFQRGYFCQESVPFTWMSNPDYLNVALSLMRRAGELHPNQAGGLWCPRSFREIADWHGCVREGRYQISAHSKGATCTVQVKVKQPCALFTISLPASAKWQSAPTIMGSPPQNVVGTQLHNGRLYLTASISDQFEWTIEGSA